MLKMEDHDLEMSDFPSNTLDENARGHNEGARFLSSSMREPGQPKEIRSMEGVHWEMKGLKLGQQSVAALHDGGRTLNVVKSSQGEVEQPASFLTRSSQSELGTNDTSRPRFGQSEIDSRSSRSEWDFLGLQTPPAQTARNRSYSARATPGGQSIVFLPNTEEILRRRYFNAPVTPGPCGKARGGIANVDAAFGLAPLGEDVREPLDNFMRPEGAKIINFKQAKKLARKAKDKEETVLAELEVDIDQSLDGVCGSATRKLFKKTSAKKVVKSTFPPIKAPMLSFEEKRALRSFASSSSFSSRAGSSFGDRNRSFTDFQMGGIVREATGAISLPVDDVEMTGVADLDQDEVATERAPSPSPATSFQVSIEGASNRKRFKPQAALSTDVKIRRGRHNGQGDRGAVPGFDNIVQDTEEQQAQDMQLADSVEPVPSSPAPAQPRTRFGGVRLLSSISTSKSQSKSTSPHRATSATSAPSTSPHLASVPANSPLVAATSKSTTKKRKLSEATQYAEARPSATNLEHAKHFQESRQRFAKRSRLSTSPLQNEVARARPRR